MGKNILAIDDNEHILISVQDSITQLNPTWKVHMAASGEEGLKIAKKRKIDLILLDIMMPGMDGWSVAREILKDKKTKKIPIIYLTAKTDDISKRMGELTSKDYIEKPFKIDDLDKRIKKIIN